MRKTAVVTVTAIVTAILTSAVWFATHQDAPQPDPVSRDATRVEIRPTSKAASKPEPASNAPLRDQGNELPATTRSKSTTRVGMIPDDLRAKGLALPVQGTRTEELRQEFYDDRDRRGHEAIDIMASWSQPVLAVEDGKIVKLFNSVRGGLPFRIGHLYTILRNHVYRGEIKHKGEIHAGDHQPIIDQALWDQAQAQLASNVAIRRSGKSSKDPSLLAGLLFDGEGNRMTPSHTVKKGVRYRYYVSRAVLDGDRDKAGCVSRVPAAELETLILQTLHQHAGLSILDSADGGRALINNLQRAVLEKDVVVLHLKPVSD